MDEKEKAARDALLTSIAESAATYRHPAMLEMTARAYRAVVGGEQPTSIKVESK